MSILSFFLTFIALFKKNIFIFHYYILNAGISVNFHNYKYVTHVSEEQFIVVTFR